MRATTAWRWAYALAFALLGGLFVYLWNPMDSLKEHLRQDVSGLQPAIEALVDAVAEQA
jgi:hypothetical protein